MRYISNELNDWAINKIKKNFSEDVALLIGHEHWKIAPDGEEISFNFFIPSSDRGYNLSQTFIIDDIGYDLFPMSWERVEGLANLNEGLTTCLMDGVILYARSEEEKERFFKLQKQAQDNLSDTKFTYRKGLENINIAMELFQNMLFEKSLSGVRKASAYVASYLAEAIATVNGTYFSRGPENQIASLSELLDVPSGFIELYQNTATAKTIEELKDICYKMLATTRDFFSARKPDKEIEVKDYNFKDLADWYQECIYWFRRLYYYLDLNDASKCFVWGCRLQSEIDCITKDFGLETTELMDVFDSADLSMFRKRTEDIQQYIVSEIRKHDVKLQEFKNLDEFLRQNS